MTDVAHTGGMVALIPRADDAARLAVDRDGAETPDELHLTVAYLGDDVMADMDPDQRAGVVAAARAAAARFGPVRAEVMSHAAFNPTGAHDREPCMVYITTGDRLPEVRDALAEHDVSEHPVWLPHVTAGYGLTPGDLSYVGPITFDRIRVALAEQTTDIPLTGPDTDPPTGPDGEDAETKAGKGKPGKALPSVGGLALIAADTGRVLMLQRALGDPEDDPAAGMWEFPGGHLEPDDATSLHGAMREWAEEVGQHVPNGGTVTHTWTSSDGIYQGHVLVIPVEDDLDLGAPRALPNPDDDSEQVAWWTLPDAARNPALRRECRRTPWDELRRALAAARKLIGSEEKGTAVAGIEGKAKVASEAGERRYRKPIGTELGQARNAVAAQAQDNPRARDQYDTLVNANPREYRAMLDDLSAADLKALAATAYSFRSSNPTVVQARIALAGAMRRQGLDINDYGGLGKSGSGSRSAPAKRRTGKGKATATPRSRTASRRQVNTVARGPQDAGKLTAGQVARLRADGWRGDPNDRSETLYPPGHRQAIKGGEPGGIETGAGVDGIEEKRTTAKPWETGKIKKAGHTVSQEKGEDGDKYPIKTIGDIAAAVKRAKGIKDPEQRDKVRKHIRAEARRLKATNMIPADWSDSGKGSKSAGFAGVVTTDDRRLLEAIEAKVMSPHPGAVKLRTYWAHGKGRAKWKPGTPGDFDRLRRHLRKYVPTHMVNGLTANIHKLATGEWPGKGRGHGKTGQPADTEIKGMVALDKGALADYDGWDGAEQDTENDDGLMLALDRYEDMSDEVTAEDEYERALTDEIDWDLEMDGTPFPTDDDDEDDDEQARPSPLPQAPADDGLAALDALFAGA